MVVVVMMAAVGLVLTAGVVAVVAVAWFESRFGSVLFDSPPRHTHGEYDVFKTRAAALFTTAVVMAVVVVSTASFLCFGDFREVGWVSEVPEQK